MNLLNNKFRNYYNIYIIVHSLNKVEVEYSRVSICRVLVDIRVSSSVEGVGLTVYLRKVPK
jgi:hypothetical protein